MRGLREAVFSPTVARRLVVAVLAAVAIIAGLLAMHTLNLHNDDTGTVTSVSVVDEHSADLHASASHLDCAASCTGDMPMHEMSSMACILALLLLVLVVGLPAMLRLHTTTNGPRQLSSRPHTAIGPRPPSLLVLSISRT